MSNIPRVIHYCWFGRNPLPDLALKCIESWKKFAPGFEIKQWNEDNFDVCASPFTQEAYEQGKYAFVSDYARLKVVYEYGGIYLDTDVELIRDISTLCATSGFIGYERSDVINTGLGFAAPQHSPTIREMLKEYQDAHFIVNGKCDTIPCVVKNTHALQRLGLRCDNTVQMVQDVIVYPVEYFCPIDYDTGKLRVREHTYSIHHYGYSWADNYSVMVMKAKRAIFNTVKHRKTAGILFNLVNKILLTYRKIARR